MNVNVKQHKHKHKLKLIWLLLSNHNYEIKWQDSIVLALREKCSRIIVVAIVVLFWPIRCKTITIINITDRRQCTHVRKDVWIGQNNKTRRQQNKHQSSITWFSFIIPSVVWPSLSHQLHQVIGGGGDKIKTAERESAFKPQHSFKKNLNNNNFDYNFKLYPKNKTNKKTRNDKKDKRKGKKNRIESIDKTNRW